MKKEKILKFYYARKMYIFPIIVAVSSLFLIVFAILPQTLKLIGNQKVASDLRAKSKVLSTKAEALESYDEEDLSKKVTIALVVFPSEKDFGNVFGLLQQVITGSGFNVGAISVSNSSSKVGSSDSFDIKVEAQGDKNLLQTLLNNLENAPRLFRVDSIDTTINPVTQVLSVSLIIKVLYALIPPSFGTIDSPITPITPQDEDLLTNLSQSRAILPQADAGTPRGKANPFE